jgi:hypothetical protein
MDNAARRSTLHLRTTTRVRKKLFDCVSHAKISRATLSVDETTFGRTKHQRTEVVAPNRGRTVYEIFKAHVFAREFYSCKFKVVAKVIGSDD